MSVISTVKHAKARVPDSGATDQWAANLPSTELKPHSGNMHPEPAESARLSLRPEEEEFLQAGLAELTGRERQVVLAICAGGTNDAIASRLCIALPTLRTHLMRLNQKLNTTSKGDVVRHAATILIDGYRRGVLGQPSHA